MRIPGLIGGGGGEKNQLGGECFGGGEGLFDKTKCFFSHG